MEINIHSEIGKLQSVILHRPGPEIERMTPENIHEALYSDILNMDIAQKEYYWFEQVLRKYTRVYYITDLLTSVLQDSSIRQQIIEHVCAMHHVTLQKELNELPAKALAEILIEGYQISNVFTSQRYPIPPLANMYYTRDASVSIGNKVLINRMRYPVRDRESYLMHCIFEQIFHASTIQMQAAEGVHVEGGDVLVAREDVLLIGNGDRTSKQAINQLIEQAKQKNIPQHIVVQELPVHPDSFIHLDMVFTFLDTHACMCYLPLITQPSNFKTTHIQVDNSNVTYTEKPTLLDALKDLHFDLEPIACGDVNNPWIQQREQWHSGANFFALAPGKIIGYERNKHTIHNLATHGFDIIPAENIVNGKDSIDAHKRCVVTISGSELPRGGGGARCMTMPVSRENVIW